MSVGTVGKEQILKQIERSHEANQGSDGPWVYNKEGSDIQSILFHKNEP